MAASTQLATTKMRALSTVSTAGLGNPVLATLELFLSALLSTLAVLWPVLAAVVAIFIVAAVWCLLYYVGKGILSAFRRNASTT